MILKFLFVFTNRVVWVSSSWIDVTANYNNTQGLSVPVFQSEQKDKDKEYRPDLERREKSIHMKQKTDKCLLKVSPNF